MPVRTASRPVSDTASLAESDAPRLNERITEVLTNAIAEGRHPVGASLPPEAQLCATFGASRFTIRQSLRRLAEIGLIETRQGAGSRVVSRVPQSGYRHVYKNLDDLFEYARDTRFAIAETGMAVLDAADALAVQAPEGSHWFRITGVRFDAERSRAISHVTVFVHSRFAGLLGDVRDTKGSVYALVEARSGEPIAEAIQEISASQMPAFAARGLGCRKGVAAMRFVRRYCDASGGVMLTSINWHVAEHFSYTMRIKRGDWKAG